MMRNVKEALLSRKLLLRAFMNKGKIYGKSLDLIFPFNIETKEIHKMWIFMFI